MHRAYSNPVNPMEREVSIPTWRRAMRETRFTPVWPETLRLRDTGLSDDLGGLGQRIYTTAGAGYEKREYVRADLAGAAPEMLQRLRDIVALADRNVSHNPDGTPNRTAEAQALYDSTIKLIARLSA
jgi:hypothetical protein